MAHHALKEKSPTKLRAHTQMKPGPTALEYGGGINFAQSIDCGCSLKSFHGNLSTFAKPTKCKLSQIWPLFRHEFALSAAAAKKLNDKGISVHGSNNANAGGPPVRRGFIRSPSPQQSARKTPLFAGVVSMQRDNYVEVSTCNPVDYPAHYRKTGQSENESDDMIPMGTIVCTAKGSPCYTNNLHCRAESGNDDAELVDKAISDTFAETKMLVRSGLSTTKRLRSTSPRSDALYTAVEREFKRLGIYKDKDFGAPQYHQNEEKPLSPRNNKSAAENDLTAAEVEIKACPFSLPQPFVEEEHHNKLIDDTCQYHHRDHAITHDDHHKHSECIDQHHNKLNYDTCQYHHRVHAITHDDDHAFEHRDHGITHDDHHKHSEYIDQHHVIDHRRQHARTSSEGARLSADTRISQRNAMESFVTLSNVLCVTQFSTIIKKAEASLHKFANYLIKAKRKMMVRENPSSQVLSKQEITVSMIRKMMPNAKFDSPHHFKYGLQACVSKVIFDQFDTQSYGGEGEESSKINRQFKFLRAYYVFEALDNCDGEQLMEINGEFQDFCHRKLEAMKRKVRWESRWPSKLLQAFLCGLKDVWVAHKLAFAFEKPATIFFVKPRSPLDLQHMNPLVESPSSKLSPNPKYMNPLMESSFTKLCPNPNTSPTFERIAKNSTVYMSPLMESNFSIKHNPNPNPSPNFRSPNLSPNFISPSPKSTFNLSPNLSSSPDSYVELKHRWHTLVQFTVFPGFLLKDDGVVHSIVFLQPKTKCVTPLTYPSLIL